MNNRILAPGCTRVLPKLTEGGHAYTSIKLEDTIGVHPVKITKYNKSGEVVGSSYISGKVLGQYALKDNKYTKLTLVSKAEIKSFNKTIINIDRGAAEGSDE